MAKKRIKRSRSDMNWQQKTTAGAKALRRNGYTEKEIKKILKLSFGDEPPAK